MSYTGPVIDCDVHQQWIAQDDLLPYLSKGWRSYVEGRAEGLVPFHAGSGIVHPKGFSRQDTVPLRGGPPGSDYETMRAQLLDPSGVYRAVLNHETTLFGVSGLPNPFLAAEVARASNDWTMEHWLSKDDRLAGSILVATQLPDAAAAEIRRLADNPRFVQVIIGGNGIGQPLGHPIFHPIYEAAAATGRPLALHIGFLGGINPSPAAGATFINYYLEFHSLGFQPAMTTAVSMIANGVFEKFPTLKLVLVENGVAWVPGLLWRLDADYKGIRREVPWLRRLPSEYFREHVRLTTQPLEESPKREQLIQLLESFNAEDMLMFATDYPHWDGDDKNHVADRLPKSWHTKVFYQNAIDLYGWPPIKEMSETLSAAIP